ncbi:MAG: serine/threonine protein kinase [Deltaproteobacteria bacterium]|nr:serine/threonine protein kinase [Deltaproteobacteria bacterium]
MSAPDVGGELPGTFFLGRYRVVDEIGVGGMASVHLARVDGPGGFQKWVAIKRIHPHLVEDDQFVDMFLDEARIAAGINHANVAQVFDLGKDDNTYWIAMEYLHGEPLREIMRHVEDRKQQVPFHLAARICADAAEGLHGAHELRGRNGQLLNLVHRDVTPHNLFLTYDGNTKVVDFGIAKVVDRLASTRAGTLKGKLAYMSPEQVRGQEVDRQTDIFALGVVLWELTTNQRLFRMDTDLDTLEKVQACVVPQPSTIIPSYPPELEMVVMKALSQRKEDRFGTAREFSRSLQRYLMKEGIFVGPEDVGDYVQMIFGERVRKRERYLEWAAEVTSAVDVDALRAQQVQGAEKAPSLLHETPAGGAPPAQPGVAVPAAVPPAPTPPPVSAGPGSAGPPAAVPPPTPPPVAAAAPPAPGVDAGWEVPSPSQVPGRAAPQQSQGQDYASASVVTSAPAPQAELASSSLMDEDEDIPTVVAQPREPEPAERGPRPAAGMPAPAAEPSWDGAATQLVEPEEDLDSTIALPDNKAAAEIRAKVDEMEKQQRQRAQEAQATAIVPTPLMGADPYGGAVQPAPAADPMHPNDPAMMQGMPPAYQAQVETKMNMPRPAAVAQWLMEQGDIEIQGPRSTGIIIAIAALATLCVMGVASLIVYKLRVPVRAAYAAPVQTSVPGPSLPADDAPKGQTSASDGTDDGDSSEDGDGSKASTKRGKGGKKGSSGGKGSGKAKGGDEPPGRLTITCKPACDSVIAGGKSLGPSPIFSRGMPPGLHQITLKRRGAKTKTIAVNIVSNQLTTKTVTMK